MQWRYLNKRLQSRMVKTGTRRTVGLKRRSFSVRVQHVTRNSVTRSPSNESNNEVSIKTVKVTLLKAQLLWEARETENWENWENRRSSNGNEVKESFKATIFCCVTFGHVLRIRKDLRPNLRDFSLFWERQKRGSMPGWVPSIRWESARGSVRLGWAKMQRIVWDSVEASN